MHTERVHLSGRSTVQVGVSLWHRPLRPPSGVLAWLLVSVLAVSVGAAVVLSPTAAGLLMFGAGVCVLIALPLTITLTTLGIAFVLPLTQLDVGVDTRLWAPALLVPLAVKGLKARRMAPGHDIALRLVPLTALATASLSWSSDALATGAAVLALIAVMACLFLVPAATNSAAVLQALRWLVGALIIVSAVAAVTPLGQLAGRSRGIFGNPNSLATLLALGVPLLMRGRWRLFLPLAFVLAYSTASRAGMAAIVAGVLFYFLSARTSRLIIRLAAVLFAVAAFTAAILALHPVVRNTGTFTQPSVFRYENSREFEWTAAMHMWREHPLIGYGFGASKLETGNSFLKLLVDLGLLGLLSTLPILLFLARRLLVSKNPVVVGSIVAGLVSSFFEAWLFTAGSAFFLLFCLVIQTEGLNDSDRRAHHRDPDPPASPRLGTVGADS